MPFGVKTSNQIKNQRTVVLYLISVIYKLLLKIYASLVQVSDKLVTLHNNNLVTFRSHTAIVMPGYEL